MAENNIPGTTESALHDTEAGADIRKLLHDMNNSLEIIIQATYLLGTLEMKEDGKQWIKLLEQGVDQVANYNLKLRELIRRQQEPGEEYSS